MVNIVSNNNENDVRSIRKITHNLKKMGIHTKHSIFNNGWNNTVDSKLQFVWNKTEEYNGKSNLIIEYKVQTFKLSLEEMKVIDMYDVYFFNKSILMAYNSRGVKTPVKLPSELNKKILKQMVNGTKNVRLEVWILDNGDVKLMPQPFNIIPDEVAEAYANKLYTLYKK